MGRNGHAASASSRSIRSIPLVPRALVVSSAGRRGRRVVKLAGASDWRRALLDSAASTLVGTVGTRALASAPCWSWPAATVEEIESSLASSLPGIEVLGAVTPRQPGRERLSLLVAAAGEPLVVKFGLPDTGIEREAMALRLLERNPLPCIRTPVVRADGRLTGDALRGDVAFVVTSVLGLDRQVAAIGEPLRTFEHDLGERLGELPRPDGTPSESVPIHGDLTPWNLRRTPRGLALFDWEAAGWGTRGSDVESYRQACDSLPRRHRPRG